ncbi:MAG: AMP-binding protein [Pseudomonadota bacterium]
MNLASWLGRAARAYPSAPAIAKGDTVVADYRTFGECAARIAAALASLGLGRGDRVGIAAKNCVEYLHMLYGIWWGGYAAVPINAKLHGAEIGWILDNSGTRVLFADSSCANAVSEHMPNRLERVIEIGSREYQALTASEAVPLTRQAPDDLAWLFYTSGTTGRPKGAMLTHRNLVAASFGYLTDVDPCVAGNGLLHAAPMSHGSGIYIMGTVAQLGVNIVPDSGGFEPDEIFGLFNIQPRTSMFAAPTMIKRLVDHGADTPRDVRTIMWGGAPMHVADTIRALDRFGPVFAQIFGQGESPMTGTVLSKADIANRDHPRWREKLATAGIANTAVDVRIGGPTDETLPHGEVGEILIRGDAVMPGYWQNPEATFAALKGGWLHTGDVGSMDEDGYVSLKDRSKDVIISGGSNIYPREVEEVLLRHEGVREVSVIGRADAEWGEIVVAYVAGDESSATPQALDALCLESIARFKRPKHYVFVEALPKNNYGKILKTKLRETDSQNPE